MRVMPRARTTPIKVHGPFSLAAAIDALDALAPSDGEPGVYEGSHSINGRPVDVSLRQTGPRRLALTVTGDAIGRGDLDVAERRVRRMFGLDLDADGFHALAERNDRVLQRLQARLRGVRPVTAPTPLAALVFVVLADEYGPERARTVVGRLDGAEDGATLAQLDHRTDATRLGIDPATARHLRLIGQRDQDGAFGADLLRSMPVHAARSWLSSHAEVGAATADLVLMAGAGRTDVVPTPTPQLVSALERYYGVARAEARRRLDELSQRWGEFSSWAVFLLLEAARRDARPSGV